MGYCYDSGGRLCCDVCGRSGNVRKHRCPYGWCQAIALCPICKQEHPEYTARWYHKKNGCESSHLKFEQEKAREVILLSAGKLIRRAALQHNGRVKVIFQNKKGQERAFWMAPRTYRSIPIGTPAILEDFKARGKVTRAKNTNLHDSEGR